MKEGEGEGRRERGKERRRESGGGGRDRMAWRDRGRRERERSGGERERERGGGGVGRPSVHLVSPGEKRPGLLLLPVRAEDPEDLLPGQELRHYEGEGREGVEMMERERGWARERN